MLDRRIIEPHSGRSWVRAVEGEGSTFSIPVATACGRRHNAHLTNHPGA